jgi:hypothetical protein
VTSQASWTSLPKVGLLTQLPAKFGLAPHHWACGAGYPVCLIATTRLTSICSLS